MEVELFVFLVVEYDALFVKAELHVRKDCFSFHSCEFLLPVSYGVEPDIPDSSPEKPEMSVLDRVGTHDSPDGQ